MSDTKIKIIIGLVTSSVFALAASFVLSHVKPTNAPYRPPIVSSNVEHFLGNNKYTDSAPIASTYAS